MSYNEILINSAEKVNNITCMGLDPQLDALNFKNSVRETITSFFKELFEKMLEEKLSPSAFKPNIGYYQALDLPRCGDFSGSLALSDVLSMLDEYFPGIPIILDSKRGDIARSSLNYAIEAYDTWKTDAITVSPYMGVDSLTPFNREGKGVYVLNRTSNPGAAVIQNQIMLDKVEERENYPLYKSICHFISFMKNEIDGLGAVVGATNMNELKDISSYYSDKDIPLLIPGVGSQGGSAEEVIKALRETGYNVALARINSSSALTHPWKKAPLPENYIQLCINNIKDLINKTRLC